LERAFNLSNSQPMLLYSATCSLTSILGRMALVGGALRIRPWRTCCSWTATWQAMRPP